MNFDADSLKSQLAPGWSPVNIVLMIFAFWVFWPLGLAMLAYILKGADFGVDLRQPGSFVPFFRNAGDYARNTFNKFNNERGSTSGTPGGKPTPHDRADESWQNTERDKLKAERASLDRERAAFEAEKRAFEQRSRTDA